MILNSRSLYDALVAVGYAFPKGCREINITFPTDGPMLLHFECLVDADDLRKLASALPMLYARLPGDRTGV